MLEQNAKNTRQTVYDLAPHSHTNHPSTSSPQLEAPRPYPCSTRSRGLWRFLAFLILVLLFVVGAISLGDRPNYFPPTLAQQLSVQVVLLIGFGVMLVLALLQGIFRRTPLRKPLLWSMGFLLLAFIAVGWLWSTFINPYVGMTNSSFVRNSVSISNGETLHMQNPADGVTQIICIGVDQKCLPEKGAPDALNHGIRVQPGQSVTITFATNGDYHITSTTMPGMNLSVDLRSPPHK